MATPWSVSVTQPRDKVPVVGTAAPTAGKYVEIRMELELGAESNTEVIAALKRLVAHLETHHLPY